MIVKTLQTSNFRIYDNLEVSFHPTTNIFIGNNAQGKTSILESLYVLAFTKSHKTYRDQDVVKDGTDFAKISADIDLNDKTIQLDIVISKAGKKAKYNHIELERLSEYIGHLNVVMFAPEDLELIKGNPKDRRKFLDVEIGQISNEYLYNLQQFRKILKQRNDLLKDMQKAKHPDLLLLDVITDQLIDYEVKIIVQRTTFLKSIATYAINYYQLLSGTKDFLTIDYIPSLKSDFKEEYSAKYQYDIITGTTNIGVHRDDVEFYLNDFPLKTHGSQGEQRTAVLAVKLALIDFIYEWKKEYPVLLLDDVLSELDITRQKNLLQSLDKQIQTFITTTDVNDIDVETFSDYRLFNITKGHIKECDNHGKKL
jgi:DNA replication and repair protein RecF